MLTIGTDNPAYPPWFLGDPPKGSTWQLADPTSGTGYESAAAYAIAGALGFSKDQVSWVVVPFNNAIQPGPKSFDILLNQVDYQPERAKAVDLSDGYFDNNQAVVSVEGNPITKATSVGDLKAFRLGAQVGTTSYTYIKDTIQPAAKVSVYSTNDLAIAGLKARQIDGIVVDLYTAYYMVGAQLNKGVIVGQLPAVGEATHFSVLLTKNSPLTACVNQALAVIKADGTLDQIHKDWIDTQGNAPVLAP